MALTLTPGSIPGSPSNGTTVAMDNGKIRVTWSYGDHSTNKWVLDKVDAWDGSQYSLVSYVRDLIRLAYSGEATAGGNLTVITNTASELTIKYDPGSIVQGGKTFTVEFLFTMRSTHDYVEVTASFSVAGGATGTVDLFGPGYFSPGKLEEVKKMFQYSESPVNGQIADPSIWREFRRKDRSFFKPNYQQRAYSNGCAFLRRDNGLFMFAWDNDSAKNLNETLGGSPLTIFAYKGYADWWPTTDAKYQTNHSRDQFFIQPGIAKNDPANGTTYSAKFWIGAKHVIDDSDEAVVREFNQMCFNAFSKPTVQAPFASWSSYATLAEAIMASTYTEHFSTTYGFKTYIGTTTEFNSFANALGIMAALRLYKFKGLADGLTEATRIKNILLNQYRITAGNQKGAFGKVYDTALPGLKCQEGAHLAAGDQPHISTYVHAEICQALMEYYDITGDNDVKTALNEAADYLVNSVTSQGFWYVESNTSHQPTSTNPNTGASYAGAATPALGAFLLGWYSRNQTHTNAAKWQKTGLRGLNYWLTKESNSHGCYEYGEPYNTLSSHGLRMIIGGFTKGYKLTGNENYRRAAAFYMEMAVAQMKKVESTFNAAASNNQNIYTFGLLSTIDWNGVVGPEAMSIYYTFMTEGIQVLRDLRSYVPYYLRAALHHTTYGLRDAATYLSATPHGYSYISPGTGYAHVSGLDNTRMLFQSPSLVLMLCAVYYLVENSNNNIIVIAVDSNDLNVKDKRTILVYNPQATTQAANITVKNLTQPERVKPLGTVVSGSHTVNATSIVVPVSLSAGQLAIITVT